MSTRRGVRTILVGLLLGLALCFGYVGFAQQNGEAMPLVTALQAAAEAGGISLVVAGVPVADVYLPQVTEDWPGVIRYLAGAYGLTLCEIGPGTWLITESPYAARVCGGNDEEPATEELGQGHGGAGTPADAGGSDDGYGDEVEERPEPVVEAVSVPSSLTYRVRVLQLDETRAVDLGLDWSGGVFETAARLMAGVAAAGQGIFPVAQMGDLVRFLESEGVAMRLEDVELRSIGGRPVNFNRGGSIAVNLVGGGDTSIEQQYQYGLGLQLQGTESEGSVVLDYRFTDSSPSNVSDPRNVQISSTTSAAAVVVPCGHSVVLAAIGTNREGMQGSGIPVASALPGLGYVFGVGGSVQGRTAFVVTVDVGCAA